MTPERIAEIEDWVALEEARWSESILPGYVIIALRELLTYLAEVIAERVAHVGGDAPQPITDGASPEFEDS